MLLENWRQILTKAWSVRLMALAAVLSGLEVAMPYLDGSMPQGRFAAVSAVVTSAALLARLLAQRGVSE